MENLSPRAELKDLNDWIQILSLPITALLNLDATTNGYNHAYESKERLEGETEHVVFIVF